MKRAFTDKASFGMDKTAILTDKNNGGTVKREKNILGVPFPDLKRLLKWR